jgi:hypothetical protein
MFVSTTTMAHRHRRSPVSRLSTRAASELRRERVLHSLQSGNPSSGAIVDTNAHLDGRDEVAPVQLASDHVWHRNVRQWGPDWLEYDEYYRPVVLNPYRAAVRIVYIYQRAPGIVVSPPLARIVLEVAEIGAYSFTAVVLNAVNTAANVAVGASSSVAISRVPGCRYRRLHRRCCAMTTSPSCARALLAGGVRAFPGSSGSSTLATTSVSVSGKCCSTARRRYGGVEADSHRRPAIRGAQNPAVPGPG